ncbi:MarR family transcriptional regulator [Allomesorhizobium alhagi]|jgi:DNA-binding MarR family transcriptional regulator|uniref:MarR family transcriptional regulator n=1 Tax=Allomesorhizobium alhagi TaxID=475067 RepID=UPI00058E5D69
MDSDDRTNNLLGALVVALGDAMRTNVESASGHGVTAAAALATAFAFPGRSVDHLRQIVGLSAAGTTRLVDKLQADGLIERRASLADGRSRAVTLTKAGSKSADAVLEARRTVYAHALAVLSARDRKQLARMLDAMLTALTPDRATCELTCRLCDIAACPQDICPVELAALNAEKS